MTAGWGVILHGGSKVTWCEVWSLTSPTRTALGGEGGEYVIGAEAPLTLHGYQGRTSDRLTNAVVEEAAARCRRSPAAPSEPT
ncbi:MAG TPA: hypothetical protein VFY14_20480 [Streptomyces sp.]|nr:hypothetical protein [Streptomyces sp.]